MYGDTNNVNVIYFGLEGLVKKNSASFLGQTKKKKKR